MTQWFDHNALALLAAWYVFSAIVSGMPMPSESSGVAYTWAFHSLRILAGDLSRYWLWLATFCGVAPVGRLGAGYAPRQRAPALLVALASGRDKNSQPGNGATQHGVDVQH